MSALGVPHAAGAGQRWDPGKVMGLTAGRGLRPGLICPVGSVSVWGCTYRRTPWGTWPAKAGSTVIMPSERILSTIRYWEREEGRKQGERSPHLPIRGPRVLLEPEEGSSSP